MRPLFPARAGVIPKIQEIWDGIKPVPRTSGGNSELGFYDADESRCSPHERG